jgi:hypothetical protein
MDAPPSPLSSRPERSEVEGPAVRLSPNPMSNRSDRMPRPSLPPGHKPRQHEIQQQPDRPKEKRQHQARKHQPERHVIPPRIPHLPATDKKIERQIMDPSGKHQPTVSEQQHDVAERVESSPMAAPMSKDEHQVQATQKRRHQQPRDQRRDHPRRPRRPSRHHQQNPTGQRRAIAKSKERIRRHKIPFLLLIAMTATAVSASHAAKLAKDKLSGRAIDCPRKACPKISPKSAR